MSVERLDPGEAFAEACQCGIDEGVKVFGHEESKPDGSGMRNKAELAAVKKISAATGKKMRPASTSPSAASNRSRAVRIWLRSESASSL